MVELIVFLPLIGFLIAGLFGRFIGHRSAEIITTSLIFISAFLSWLLFFKSEHNNYNIVLAPWLNIGDLHLNWSFLIDNLSKTMFLVVSNISALVHLYSIAYMHHDKNRARFFAYLSFFTFMMLMLITADNLLQLFFGWEGVGLVSYLLIGFWYNKESANRAALKAFIVNRVGDCFFLIGIFIIYQLFNSINFSDIFAKIAQSNAFSSQLLNFACLALFIGAMGKSAQFFLHVWLADAMEGPTPVSALIHAATMVTAGVFLICRMQPLFDQCPTVLSFIIVIGSLTAFFAATVALVQTDIKRVIAYSTCSQLGYMFAAAGAGAYNVAMYHLFTHAFFKALLFLSAGSIIHALSDEQDLRKMGGLYNYLPLTYSAMIAGTFSITGLGLPNTILGTSGFFSKDAILETLYSSNTMFANFSFWILVFVALLTSFYSWRLIFMAFHGKTKVPMEHRHQIHESGFLILFPLGALVIGSLFAGFAFKDYFIQNEYNFPLLIKLLPFMAMIIGFIFALLCYVLAPSIPNILAQRFSLIYNFLLNKWYIDELYQFIFVAPMLKLGNFLYRICDLSFFENLGPVAISNAIFSFTAKAVRLQSGFVYHYAFVIIASIVGLLSWVMIGSLV